MYNNDYRSMFNTVIGPIINYFGFHMNNDGIIQKIGSNVGITLSGKHLYIPRDGEDFFLTKDSPILIPFNPFKIREHVLLLSQFFATALSDKFRDDDDNVEYNPNGSVIDIVLLAKRGARTEDKLPATFSGVIYEMWCRDETDVIGFGIDHDGNDIKAIIMCMIDCLSRYSHLVDKTPNFDRIFKYIERVEHQRDLEIETTRAKFATNNQQMDISGSVDNSEVAINVDVEGEDDNVKQPMINFGHSDIPDNMFDEIEF